MSVHHQIKFKEIDGQNIEEHEQRQDVTSRLAKLPEFKEATHSETGGIKSRESRSTKKE